MALTPRVRRGRVRYFTIRKFFGVCGTPIIEPFVTVSITWSSFATGVTSTAGEA